MIAAPPSNPAMTESIILIVDDIEANRLLLEDLLDYPELELHSVADGASALARAAEVQPDLVVLDVMMPEMDGYEVCTRLRADAQLREVPIIMVTALDEREARLRGIDAGADDFITKPFDRIELRARVRGILRLNRFRRMQQASERIREQAELIDLAPDAIIVCDLGQRITHWNSAAGRLYGWSAAEATGQRADVLFAKGGNEDAPKLEPVFPDEWRGEVTQITRDEKEIIVDSRRRLLRDAGGRPKAFLIINTDLTEKKKLETQFLRAQRLESIGTLASGIAHDLNNALAPSLMSIDLLRDRLKQKDDVALIDMLEASTHRGAKLVRQILGFARGSDGEKTEVQLCHLVKEMHRMLSRTFPRNIEIKTEHRGEIWPVNGNATQLDQILMNFCVNARDAMPEGGSLLISIENVAMTEADCAAHPSLRPGPCVLLTVADTGTGMPAAVREKIFDPFFTTKEHGKGTGLGLSTVFGVVKGHAGGIAVESEEGAGTRFKVWLPAMTEPSRDVSLADGPQECPRGGGERVLIVDDEDSILRVVGAILEPHGYQVLYASDGIGALKLFNEHMESIRLVITDGMMPQLNGTLLARAIHRMSPGLPILLMTGILNHAVPEDGSITEILQKPFTPEKLLQAIRRALDSRTASTAGAS